VGTKCKEEERTRRERRRRRRRRSGGKKGQSNLLTLIPKPKDNSTFSGET